MLKVNHLFISLCIALFSCQSPENIAKNTSLYFDMKALISAQVAKLNAIKPIFSKTAMLNGVMNKVEVKNLIWEKELKIFENIDLNKPIYRGMYTLKTTSSDSTFVDYYEKTKDSKSQIAYVSITSTKTKKLKSIEGLQLATNLVFNAENRYLIKFDTSTQLINFYQLVGWQGFNLGKRDSFLIEAKISKF